MTSIVFFMFLASLLTFCKAIGKPVDCSDIFRQTNNRSSGVYTIYPFNERFPTKAYCDMETEGGRWTVFQRRMDGTVNFYRPWDQYVAGFGEADGEYWLGLDFIYRITARGDQELLIEMEDFDGNKAFARYSSFSVGADCDGYRLKVSGFIDGGAGDGLTYHNAMKFTTFDNDQDNYPDNCAKLRLGAFWFNSCNYVNPNGVYRWGADATISYVGIEWKNWKDYNYSLKFISMKTRPLK